MVYSIPGSATLPDFFCRFLDSNLREKFVYIMIMSAERCIAQLSMISARFIADSIPTNTSAKTCIAMHVGPNLK